MQDRFDNSHQYFFKDDYGEKRSYGIYSPSIDRFILIDDLDLWTTIETAEILSSKIPTLVYVMPYLGGEINNDNCLEFTIENKFSQKVGNSSISNARQSPMLKFLYDDDRLTNIGEPVDLFIGQESLDKLKKYSDFVLTYTRVLNLTEMFYNQAGTSRFKNLISDSNISFKEDRSLEKDSMITRAKKILYYSNNIETAESSIIDLFLETAHNQYYLIRGFFKILGEEIPSNLQEKLKGQNADLSISIF